MSLKSSLCDRHTHWSTYKKNATCLRFVLKYSARITITTKRREGTDSGILTDIKSCWCVYKASKYNSIYLYAHRKFTYESK